MTTRQLNENGKMIALMAAIIIAGERANPQLVNNGNLHTLSNNQGTIIQTALQTAGEIVARILPNKELSEET